MGKNKNCSSQHVMLYFQDYNKAFRLYQMRKALVGTREYRSTKTPDPLTQKPYENSYGKIKVSNSMSKPGVRQGCIASPTLFNIYAEYIMRNVLQSWRGGLTPGGKRVTGGRHAIQSLFKEPSQIMTG